jgi:cytochrome c biogenesis protein CcmG/thiol:disulfide interchange protein DsbE
VSNRPTKKKMGSERVRNARKAGSSNRNLWIFGGLIVVLAVALGVAVAVTRTESDVAGGGESPSGGTVVPSGDRGFGEVTVEGEPLPALPAGGSDPAVGLAAPSVSGVSFDGSAVELADDGKGKVVIFLAHWCPHCRAEVPRIQSWLDDNGMPTDVDVVAVATGSDDTRPNYPAGPWLRTEGWSVPTLLDDQDDTALAAFGSSGFPFFVAIDAEGQVVARASGEIDTATWEGLLAAAAGEPATAS